MTVALKSGLNQCEATGNSENAVGHPITLVSTGSENGRTAASREGA